MTNPEPQPARDGVELMEIARRCVFDCEDAYDGDSISKRLVQALREYGHIVVEQRDKEIERLMREWSMQKDLADGFCSALERERRKARQMVLAEHIAICSERVWSKGMAHPCGCQCGCGRICKRRASLEAEAGK